jgi:hypothetical protein
MRCTGLTQRVKILALEPAAPEAGDLVPAEDATLHQVVHGPAGDAEIVRGFLQAEPFVERLPHLMAPVARGLDAVVEVLGVVNEELDRRQALLAGAGVETLGGWNEARPDEALPHVLVIVDECAELSAAEVADRDERARRQQALAHLSRLCRLGRASGVHVIVSTQRPDADAVPGQVKANIPATVAVAFRVRNATNSRILLGEGGESAAELPPWPGRGVWQWDTETQFQAPWLSVQSARRLLEAAYPDVHAAGTAPPCPQSPREEAA